MEALSVCAASFWKGMFAGAALTLVFGFVLLSVGIVIGRDWPVRRSS